VATSRHAKQNNLSDAIRKPFRISERERAAPRSAEHQPSLDAQMLAQSFDIRDEVRSVVAREVHLRRTRVRRAPSAIALIEQSNPICRWIEQPAMPLRTSRSRTAMQHNGRLAARIPARLPVHAIPVTDVEHPLLVRLDRWI
jgi:hypothetical protein